MKKLLPHIGFIFKRNIRDKKNIYFIIMMSLCSFVLLAVLNFHHMRSYTGEWVKEHEIGMRQLSIEPSYDEAMKFFADNSYDFNINELKKIPHVTDIHSSEYDYVSLKDIQIEEINGKYLSLQYGGKNITPNVINGTDFESTDRNVLVCPDKLYLDLYNDDPKEKEMIDGNSLLGKTVKGTYNARIYDDNKDNFVDKKMTVEFKIVGIYDSSSRSRSFGTCYIPGEQLKEIITSINGDQKDSFTDFIVTIDRLENKQEVSKVFREKDFIVTNKAFYSSKEESQIKTIYVFILMVAFISILLVSFAYIKKKIINNLETSALSKSLGFKKKEIVGMYLIDNSVVVVLSYLSSLILFFIFSLIAKKFFYSQITSLGARWNIVLWPFVVTFLVLMIVSSIVNYYYTSKRVKNTPIGILNGETI